ncbi:MAG: extensin [Salinarimonadaceae bacterium]|nr:MAG: extensin [Salinarimonadaceae bacterium]
MRRVMYAFTVLSGVGLALSGCGLFSFEEREAWRGQAEQACLAQGLVQPSAYASRMSSINGPGVCGMEQPFRVTALAGGEVELSRTATLACPIIASTEDWLRDIVQPASQLYFGARVVEIRSGDYSCRTRNNQRGARLSEHAFGNAVDVMAFRLSDGRLVTVQGGWNGEAVEREFLREVFVGACRYFTTVLGPGSDRFHYDHFHIDLARHDPAGRIRVCRPTLKFTPRIDPQAVSGPMSTRTFGMGAGPTPPPEPSASVRKGFLSLY